VRLEPLRELGRDAHRLEARTAAPLVLVGEHEDVLHERVVLDLVRLVRRIVHLAHPGLLGPEVRDRVETKVREEDSDVLP
jgi:hypothetical protein